MFSAVSQQECLRGAGNTRRRWPILLERIDMSNSTKRSNRPKPQKPRPDFPLFPHATGRWAKKVRGRLVYFGKIADDPNGEAALAIWCDEKDDLLAGRVPRRSKDKDADGLELVDLVNRYLTAAKQDVSAGELSSRTFRDAYFSCEKVLGHFGRNRLVSDIRADDFASYRESLIGKYASSTCNLEIARCKAVFNWGFSAGLYDVPLRYGPQFKVLSKKATRRQKANAPSKAYTAAEIRQMIDAAGTQLKAMVMLGINAGFGNTDVSNLPQDAIDLAGGWVEFPRPKTGVERRCPLWPETAKALRDALATRPAPNDPQHNRLVFITAYGNPWVRMEPSKKPGKGPHWQDAVAVMFRILVKDLGLVQRGRGFYSLRRTFRTVADEALDQVAANYIMGHADESMAGVYRQHVADERLKRVTDYVHTWLFPEAADD